MDLHGVSADSARTGSTLRPGVPRPPHGGGHLANETKRDRSRRPCVVVVRRIAKHGYGFTCAGESAGDVRRGTVMRSLPAFKLDRTIGRLPACVCQASIALLVAARERLQRGAGAIGGMTAGVFQTILTLPVGPTSPMKYGLWR